jgi:hypothetical protein
MANGKGNLFVPNESKGSDQEGSDQELRALRLHVIGKAGPDGTISEVPVI